MRCAAAILLSFLSVSIAAAETAETLFSQFDLYGAWAVNCDRPASPVNPHVTIAAISAGVLTEEQNTGPDFQVNSYLIVTAERLDAQRLSVHAMFRAGGGDEVRQKIVWQIANNTRRTLLNQSDAGKVFVKDGIVLSTGGRTPTLRKCK